MRIYHYDHHSRELLAYSDARVVPTREKLPDDDPKKWLIPANATTIEPPPATPGQADVFLAGQWVKIADHRGEKWFNAAGQEVEITEPGDPTAFDDPLSQTAPAPPPPTIDDVREEAQRRIIALMGARDFADCIIKQLNANKLANSLNDKRIANLAGDGPPLTDAEVAQAAELRALTVEIDRIRARSNEIGEPVDYSFREDQAWLPD